MPHLGYPLADIDREGNALIRLLDGAPGRIDPVSCTLQLLYEVHDPARYITPDAILDFSALHFEPAGANRVHMTGARGVGRPDTLKVIGFVARRGIIADVEIGFAGTGALERARRAADVLRLRLAREIALSDMRIDLVGVELGAGRRVETEQCRAGRTARPCFGALRRRRVGAGGRRRSLRADVIRPGRRLQRAQRAPAGASKPSPASSRATACRSASSG